MLPEEERRQLLIDWNGTDVDYPQLPLHELVEEQVRRSPDGSRSSSRTSSSPTQSSTSGRISWPGD